MKEIFGERMEREREPPEYIQPTSSPSPTQATSDLLSDEAATAQAPPQTTPAPPSLPAPVTPTTATSSSKLNPDAAPFRSIGGSSGAASGKDLPSWLRFYLSTSSSSEGKSPSPRHGRASFSNIIKGKGIEGAGPSSTAPSNPSPRPPHAEHRQLGRSLAAVAVLAPPSRQANRRHGRPGDFMANARRRPPPTSRPSSSCHQVDADGWQVVSRRGRWRRLQRSPPPPTRRLVPADLVGRCFNCLGEDHVTAACTNASRCLQCHTEGHQASACKRTWSQEPSPPPQQHRRPQLQVAIPFREATGSIVLANRPPRSRSSSTSPPTPGSGDSPTPPGSLAGSTPPGSPRIYILP